jgi:hypothetical protein
MDYRTGVMLDLETLGVTYDSIIVSLAAVKFSISHGVMSEFTVNIDPADSKRYGLKTDKATLEWWAKQPKATVDAWRLNPVPLKDAMTMFCDWYGTKTMPTWAKGGQCFDFPILETSLKKAGLFTPYHFRDCMDYRTVINLFDFKDWKAKSVSHCALDDCKDQCNVLIPLLAALRQDDPRDATPTDLRCSTCGESQFDTPSGLTCANGHGGADSI